MTIWTPDISARGGPKYRALAEAIADAIATGELPAGTRLPTHRDLAWKLGVTVGTVTRAYALAQAEGHIAGEVGRGTYVMAQREPLTAQSRDAAFKFPMAAFDRPGENLGKCSSPIAMNQNFPADPWVNELLAQAMQRLARPERLNAIEGYLPSNGLRRHRAVARSWLQRFGIDRGEDSILIVNGCQHGLSIAFMALAKPGDTILVESLTWPGARQLAELLGLRVVPVAIDDQGILPDAFEAACREASPRLLYTVPTLHNPTTSVLPVDRRRAIADIASRHDVYIVEDDVFGYVAEDSPPPIGNFAPELGIYVTSLSTPVAPILRTGFISAPEALVPRLAGAIRATALMPSALNTELAVELILSGAAEAAAERQRREAATRQKMASEILGDVSRLSHPNGTHTWLRLPPIWTSAAFTAEALARGVAVTPGNAFAADENSTTEQAVRVCISAEQDRERIRQGLEIIAGLMKSTPPAADPIV
jgi:DNA-binding transcriptional MocR family regulator